MKNLRNTADKGRGLLSLPRRWFNWLLPGSMLLLLLTIWELAVRFTGIEAWILPAPSVIFITLWQTRDLLVDHGVHTIYETLLGLGIAIMVGVLLAVFIDLSEKVRKSVYPLFVASQTIPIIAIAPLFAIWFGYGYTPKIILVALFCFFPITVSLADGFLSVDRQMIRLLDSMGASRSQIFRMVKLPAALPAFFSGLRIAGTYSVMAAVISEWLGASKGLGIFMTRSSQSFFTDRVFAIIMVITLLSLVIYGIIEGMSRLVMPWYYKKQK